MIRLRMRHVRHVGHGRRHEPRGRNFSWRRGLTEMGIGRPALDMVAPKHRPRHTCDGQEQDHHAGQYTGNGVQIAPKDPGFGGTPHGNYTARRSSFGHQRKMPVPTSTIVHPAVISMRQLAQNPNFCRLWILRTTCRTPPKLVEPVTCPS